MGARLTEAQIAVLRPQYTEYPERRIIVPAYPPARRKRGLTTAAQAALQDEEAGALPTEGISGALTVRLWNVAVFTNTVAQSIQRGSPAFVGPALIHSFTGTLRGHDTGSVVYPAQIAYSSNPYSDTDLGASLAKLPGTHITFNSDPYSNGARSALHTEGFLADISTPLGFFPFGTYVTLDRFYIGLLFQGSAAGQAGMSGFLRVIEGAPPESIAWV